MPGKKGVYVYPKYQSISNLFMAIDGKERSVSKASK